MGVEEQPAQESEQPSASLRLRVVAEPDPGALARFLSFSLEGRNGDFQMLKWRSMHELRETSRWRGGGAIGARIACTVARSADLQ